MIFFIKHKKTKKTNEENERKILQNKINNESAKSDCKNLDSEFKDDLDIILDDYKRCFVLFKIFKKRNE